MKRIAIIIGLNLFTTVAIAETCADYLRTVANGIYGVMGTAIVVSPGLTWLTTSTMVPQAKKLRREAKVLDSASVLKNPNGAAVDRIPKARNVMENYHRKLKSNHIHTKVSFDDMVTALNEVNQNGVDSGFCAKIQPRDENNQRKTLRTVLFADGSLQSYQDFKASKTIQ